MSCANGAVAVAGCLDRHSGVPVVTAGRRKKQWEMLENEFLEFQLQTKIDTLESHIRYYEDQLPKIPARQRKKKETTEMQLGYARERLKYRRENGFSDRERAAMRQQYVKIVKTAIKKSGAGETDVPVPEAVIAQYEEFETAKTNYERYLKGRHTSYANKSVAVDDSMLGRRGYKVKRQDGKAMTSAQLREIEQGVDEIELVLGPIDEILRHLSPTISHCNGKHPFLKTAVGLYSVDERTVSIGTKRMFRKGENVPALAHELFGHCLDYEAGKRLGMSTRVSNKSRSKSWDASAISEYDNYSWGEAADLCEDASRCMNDSIKVRGFLKPGSKPKGDASDEDKDNYETVKLKLGHYYNRPREIWARLCEQYVSTKLREQGHDMINLASVEADYTSKIAYWAAEDWKRLEPMVEREINRRLDILRADDSKIDRLRITPRYGRPVRTTVGKLPGLPDVVHVKSGYHRDDSKKLDVVRVAPGKWAVYRTWYERGQGHQAEQVSGSAEMTLEQAKVVAGNMLLTRARRDENGYTVVD